MREFLSHSLKLDFQLLKLAQSRQRDLLLE